MEVTELQTEPERRAAIPILRQLWTEAEPMSVLEWTGADEYHLFGGHVDGELVGVAGVLVTELLHHETNAWLYDLVVDEARRGEGHGSRLVEFVEDWAAERGCKRVALGSPVSKSDVHEFYRDREYEKWGYVIEKEVG